MTGISSGYAQALYSLAKEENIAEQILEQLKTLDAAFSQEPDFLRLLATHDLSKDERCAILDSSFRGKLHPYVLNFLKILTEKGYARSFGQCVKAYRQQYNEDNGIVSVLAFSAVPLTDAQQQKLRQKLETVTGKTVELRTRVDAACMGGVRLDYDGKRIDGTVKSRQDAIRAQLNNTVL